jgi:hypothetical protein
MMAACLVSIAAPVLAEERYALVVTGAPGGEQFAQTFAKWERELVAALQQLGFAPDQVMLLSGVTTEASHTSTGEHVRDAIARIKSQARREDVLLLVLVGHGSVDGGSAKFNLVGPDLTSTEWADLLRDLTGRLVVVNTTGASFPFLADLAAKGRIVITATDSIAQRFDTYFPEAFVAALSDPAADLDKNGRVSVWELFAFTSRAVTRHYEQEGLLATERPLLDDTGAGRGTEAPTPGADGALARATYLERDPLESTSDPAMAALLARRRALEEQAEQLRQKRSTMAPDAWAREFEQLMIELARVSKQIRSSS